MNNNKFSLSMKISGINKNLSLLIKESSKEAATPTLTLSMFKIS